MTYKKFVILYQEFADEQQIFGIILVICCEADFLTSRKIDYMAYVEFKLHVG